MFSVYLITNKENGKVYVGQTCKTIDERWKEHVRNTRRSMKRHFCNAIRKYGENSFTIERLALTPHKHVADVVEKFFIAKYDSINNGYNLTEGGEGNVGWTPSKETRHKISTTLTGRINGPHSLETREKIGNAQRGRKVSPEHLSHMIISRNSPEVQAKHRIAHAGIKHTDETKKKLSLAHSGKKLSEEHKAKIRNKMQTPEMRLKMSMIKKGIEMEV